MPVDGLRRRFDDERGAQSQNVKFLRCSLKGEVGRELPSAARVHVGTSAARGAV